VRTALIELPCSAQLTSGVGTRRAIERVAIGLQGFQGRSSVCSWLHRIAVNGCLNALRDRSRRPGQGRKEPSLSSGRPRCLNE